MSIKPSLNDLLSLDRKNFDKLSSKQKQTLEYFTEFASKYGVSVEVVSKPSEIAKANLDEIAIDALYPKEVRVSFVDQASEFMPFTKQAWLAFGENLNTALFEGTKGQFRRKASWLRARIAKSLPFTPSEFNENTLMSYLKTYAEVPCFHADLVRWAHSVDIDSLDDLTLNELCELPSVDKTKLLEIARKVVDTCHHLNLVEDELDDDGFKFHIYLADDNGEDTEIDTSYEREEEAICDAFQTIMSHELTFTYGLRSQVMNDQLEHLTRDLLNTLEVPSDVYTDRDIYHAVISGYMPLQQVGYAIQKNTSPKSLQPTEKASVTPELSKDTAKEQTLLNDYVMNSECGIAAFLSENTELIASAIVDTVNEDNPHGEDIFNYINEENAVISEWSVDLCRELRRAVNTGNFELREELMAWATSRENMELLNEAHHSYLSSAEKTLNLTEQLTIAAAFAAKEQITDQMMGFLNEIGVECLDEDFVGEATSPIVKAALEGRYISNMLVERAKEQSILFNLN